MPNQPPQDATTIPDILDLSRPDRTAEAIQASLDRGRPRLFDSGGLCADYALEPSPGEYFVAHEASPEKVADLRRALEVGLAGTQLRPYTPDQDVRPGHILCKIAAKIQTTAFCIFDLPESLNRNVYLELGIAIGLGRPFILIRSEDAEVPSLVQGLDHFGFSSYSGLRREVGGRVQVGRFSAILPRQAATPSDTYFLADGEFEREDFRDAIAGALAPYRLQAVYLAEGQAGTQLALNQLLQDIQAARFGIYRIDEQASADSFLALGIAIGLNRPWLLVARGGAAVPRDVRGLSNLNFRSFTHLETEFTERCSAFLQVHAGWAHTCGIVQNADRPGAVQPPATPPATALPAQGAPRPRTDEARPLPLTLDYELGLARMREHLTGGNPELRSEFDTLEARLLDNLQDEGRYGPSEITRSGRARIVDGLNRLAGRAGIGSSFNDLCRGR